MRKHPYITAILIVCAACAVFVYAAEGRTKYEMPQYTVAKKDGNVEIRRYEPYIVAYTDVEGDPKAAGNEGFSRLFRYISGANQSRSSIAMTAPVTQSAGAATGQPDKSEKIAMTAPVGQELVDGQWRITFMMPDEYTLDTLPEPTDSSVKLQKVPGQAVAAIRYSGTWGRERYEKHEAELKEWIAANGMQSIGEPIWARYDPPFKPWFMRRNEVIIPIEETAKLNTLASPDKETGEKGNIQVATFGAGCFWCVEAVFQRLEGVMSVESGYAGGTVKNPTYEQVCSGRTGHAEVCQIKYDPDKVSYPTLLEVFWKTHDPTTMNRQGYDVGTQYRSVIFYHTEEQKELAEKYRKKLDESGAFDDPIVTEIEPATEFYKAEGYHQNYYNTNPNKAYCARIIGPKLKKFEKVFKDKLKTSDGK